MSVVLNGILCTNIGITSQAIMTTAGLLYGAAIIPKSTGIVMLYVFDETATASGTQVLGVRVSSTAGIATTIFAVPIACRTGIFASVVTSSVGDQVVIFYGPSV